MHAVTNLYGQVGERGPGYIGRTRYNHFCLFLAPAEFGSIRVFGLEK